MLKMTGVKLDLTSDIDMYQFMGKGFEGGVSCITQRYSKAYTKRL